MSSSRYSSSVMGRMHIIVIRQEGLVLACVPVSASVGKAVHIQRVAPEHTAHGVREQRNDLVPLGAYIVAALHGFRHIVLGVKDAVNGHILVCHIWGLARPASRRFQ